jgi:phosphoribosylaminoimidazole-succinocarboxamide synthase
MYLDNNSPEQSKKENPMSLNPKHIDSDWTAARAKWDTLEVRNRGESKDIRIIDDSYVMVRLIPSLYSYTHNRSAMIDGTDTARLRSFERLTDVLQRGGVRMAAVAFGDDYYVTQRLLRNGIDYVPPIEVIVKARHVGTPKHSLYRIADHQTLGNKHFQPDKPHMPYVRFDYTNPQQDTEGKRLRDECIPSQLAAHFIDVAAAEHTALSAFSCLYANLSMSGIRLDDVCFKIDHTGRTIFGEVSPDCMRAVWVGDELDFFGLKGLDASKDTFRAGSSEDEVKSRYDRFVALLDSPIRAPVSPFDCPSQV